MRINLNEYLLGNEGCILINMESGRCKCILVKKHDKFVEYVHETPLEGTKTALVRRCSRKLWDNYSYKITTPEHV